MPDEDGGIGLNHAIRGPDRPAGVSSRGAVTRATTQLLVGRAFDCACRG